MSISKDESRDLIKNEKILVTGGAGFIGSHLTEWLCEHNEVLVLDSLLRGNKIPKEILSKINLVVGDIRDRELVLKISEGCQKIFHMAAILGVDIVADNPIETMDTEIIGMRNVSEAALNNGSKIIYASTSGIYGHSAIEKSVTEDVMVDPRTSYAMAKRYNEIYMAALREEKGIEGIALRYFNVYGPRQDERMVMPRFIHQALNGDPITVFGNGEQTRDFTYIDDTVISTILAAVHVSGFEIFNVANENEESIKNLALNVIEFCNTQSEIKLVDAPRKRYDYEVGRRVGSSDKLYAAIGYKPQTKLDDGLRTTLDYMLANSGSRS